MHLDIGRQCRRNSCFKNSVKMKRDHLQSIGNTLLHIVAPDMTPKKLLKAIRKKHPKATKRDIVRAACYAIITNADAAPKKSKELRHLAISELPFEAVERALKRSRPATPGLTKAQGCAGRR